MTAQQYKIDTRTLFPNLVAALADFDECERIIYAQFDLISTQEEYNRVDDAMNELYNKVRRAYYEDTKEFNRLEDCLLVHPYDLKKLIKAELPA